jgi:uncharacterized caspase-like protein
VAKTDWHFWKRALQRLAAVCVSLMLFAPLAHAERLAFVVGNADYDVAPDLANPVGDATAVADALKRLGFKVTLMTNAGGDSLWAEMDKFVKDSEGAESTVFYYSGHAFQMSGVNYLVPVTAKLDSRDGAKAETWSLDGIIARLQSRNRQTLIFLDACRNDPLPAAVRGSGAAADGLARVQAGVGTFVAFSTEPGGVAADAVGDSKNSPFTTALLSHIETEGISISDMMIEVRNDVENATLRKQVPWDQSSLREQFYFVPQAEVAKQELSEADYELLAQLDPDDRKQFMDLLAQSGFDEASLAEAEAAIAVSEANLVLVASETTIIGAPEVAAAAEAAVVTEPVAETQVAEAGTAEPALDDLASLEVVDTNVTIGQAPAQDDVTPLDPAKTEEEAPIRLAALDWDTRDVGANGVTTVKGRVVTADTEDGRAILAAIDPNLLTEEVIEIIPPEQLAMAVQTELKRVGCYQMKVDGSWGKGSRTALTSYFLAKRQVPDSLEPTEALYAALKSESKVVCEVRVAKSAVKTGNRTKAPEPVEDKVDVKSTKKTGKKQETAKTRITKGTIGMTGSF